MQGFLYLRVSLPKKVRGLTSGPSLRGDRLVEQLRGEVRRLAALIALHHCGSNPFRREPEPHKACGKIMDRD